MAAAGILATVSLAVHSNRLFFMAPSVHTLRLAAPIRSAGSASLFILFGTTPLLTLVLCQAMGLL